MRPVLMSPAMAALFGSLVGALGSSVSTWITQRHADRRDLLARRVFYRVQLYSDFITESERILVDALENKFQGSQQTYTCVRPFGPHPAYFFQRRIGERGETRERDRQKLQRAEPDARANPILSLERQRSAETVQRNLSRGTRLYARPPLIARLAVIVIWLCF
jgi:hypothetical protein